MESRRSFVIRGVALATAASYGEPGVPHGLSRGMGRSLEPAGVTLYGSNRRI